jgi:hypothetical protein
MRAEEEEWRRYSFTFVAQYAGVHDTETGLKLVEPTERGRTLGLDAELYHLPSDPLERVDLALERPAEVERLQAVLSQWIERHPTESTKGVQRSERRKQQLQDLGYTGDHAPGLDEDRGQ